VTGPARGTADAGTRAAVLGYVEALNAGDPDAIAARVTEDFDNEHTSARGRRVVGRAAYRAALPGFLGAFTGLRYETEELIVERDRAALGYRMTARMRVDDREVPITVRGMFRFRVRDGLVAHRVDYWDGEQVTAQLTAPS
jgi:ketosteroid isomerase-like protein